MFFFQRFPFELFPSPARLEDILAEDAIKPLMAPWLREKMDQACGG